MVASFSLNPKALIFLILASLGVFLSASPAAGLKVNVTVSPKIEANYYLINMSSGPVQKTYVAWENSGSVGCSALPRIEFYNASHHLTYTAWAQRKSMWPGDRADWLFYSALPPGTYKAKVEVRYCRKDFEYGPYNLEVKDYKTPDEEVLDIVGSKTYENYVELTLRSNRTLKNLAVIPTEYPTAWVFASNEIKLLRKGEKRKVRLFYEPSIWEEREVEIKVVTMDGNYSTAEKVLLRRKTQGFIDRLLSYPFSLLKGIAEFLGI